VRLWPARRYMTDVTGRCHGRFLRLEHLDEDLSDLTTHLGFTPELPRANASDREADYRAYYSAAMRRRVAEICAEDIAQFGYRY